MRISSTNSILIGIAFCDLIVLSQNVYERSNNYWFTPIDDPCVNMYSYRYLLSVWIGDFLRESCERASFCLGALLALIRLLIMKLAGKYSSLSETLIGYLFSIIILMLSFLPSLYYHCHFKLVKTYTWIPNGMCTGFSENYTEDAFSRLLKHSSIYDEVTKVYQYINGICRIFISIAYPILAILLIFEIRKYTKTKTSKKNHTERSRSAHMILVMTVFYIIASFPGGASYFMELFEDINSESLLEIVTGYGSIFISALFCLNSTLHCIINFTMSCNYRNAVRKILRIQKKKNSVTTVVARISSY